MTAIDTAQVRVRQPKDAGVFYSTLYAYDPAYRMTRLQNFGVGAGQRLLGDVSGDGKDDAVATFHSIPDGLRVEVAVSDGTNFVNPSTWLTWPGAERSWPSLLTALTWYSPIGPASLWL